MTKTIHLTFSDSMTKAFDELTLEKLVEALELWLNDSIGKGKMQGLDNLIEYCRIKSLLKAATSRLPNGYLIGQHIE